MLPVIHIFGHTIAMYGLMIVLGIGIGVLIAVMRRNLYQVNIEDIIYASCYAGVGLVIGAKILYIITIIPEILHYLQNGSINMELLLPIITGGFVFYGGLIGALLGYYIYCRKYKINLIIMLELMIPSIPIIHGFGRIGCFFAGCCYGIVYHGFFHVTFHNSPVAPNGISLLPIQLMESGLNFLAGILLLIYSGRIRKSGRLPGIYIIYYSIMRFILEFFRGDTSRGIIGGLSTSQWISIALIPLGLWLYKKGAVTKRSFRDIT